jgi:predicted dehydrogenase
MKSFGIAFICSLMVTFSSYTQKKQPLKVAVIGLTHTHVHWILGSQRGDVEIVGIVEPNKDLAKRYMEQHGLSMNLVFDSMDDMLKIVKPEAVTAFGTIYEHLEVVEKFAPLGIHVMVEKPLAVSLEHAKKMKALAEKYNIHLLTNYETTWYATNHKAYQMVHDEKAIGPLRKIVVHDGHDGPKEIGVNTEFLDWLTDPVQNGGGALTDFGCYGANLVTWLMKGERPVSVTAVTQQIKPEIYPKVDDDATIIVQYPKTQAIIQASWNWPFSRKDMEVYGKTGYILADNQSEIRIRLPGEETAHLETLDERPSPYDDPFAYLAAVINGEITMQDYNLSSLENNMLVVEILEAAKQSAKTGKTVFFDH